MLGRRSCSIALVALVLTGAACSSDGSTSADKAATKKTTTTLSEEEIRKAITPSTKPAPKTTAKSDKAFCETFAKMQTIDLEKPANTPEAIRTHYQAMLDLAPALEKASPDSLKANVATAARITKQVVDSGSVAPFQTPESTKNAAVLAEYARSHCAASSS